MFGGSGAGWRGGAGGAVLSSAPRRFPVLRCGAAARAPVAPKGGGGGREREGGGAGEGVRGDGGCSECHTQNNTMIAEKIPRKAAPKGFAPKGCTQGGTEECHRIAHKSAHKAAHKDAHTG